MNEKRIVGRNPLKSGQCFLPGCIVCNHSFMEVAIPSNRVNVSYKEEEINYAFGKL